MASIDKFARLAALRPAEGTITRDERTPAEDSQGAGLDECALARLLGATIFSTKYGRHLSIRNWYATPEFPEVAPAALDLLCKTQDAARTKKWRAGAEDIEKRGFLLVGTKRPAGWHRTERGMCWVF